MAHHCHSILLNIVHRSSTVSRSSNIDHPLNSTRSHTNSNTSSSNSHPGNKPHHPRQPPSTFWTTRSRSLCHRNKATKRFRYPLYRRTHRKMPFSQH